MSRKTREQTILDTELKNPCYIGEDGAMCVKCPTELGALRKFRKQWINDCGIDDEALGEITSETIGVGWLHLVTDSDRRTGEFEDDCEWYISYKEKSPYEVWVYGD